MIGPSPEDVVRFGSFVLDERLCELRRDGERIELQRRPMALLWYLVRQRARVVPGRELLDQVWPGVHVGEQSLASALRDVRRALSDVDHSLVRTLRGRGYRFTAAVEPLDSIPAERARPASAADDVAPECAAERSPACCPASGLVGRDHEWRRLIALLDAGGSSDAGRAARTGPRREGRVALLVGTAGIGKTRLADALCDHAAARGFAIHRSACHATQGIPALWPWTQLVRQCLASCPDDARRRDWERRAGASLGALIDEGSRCGTSTRELARTEPVHARFELARGCARLLGAAASTQPRVWLIEDLHWADPDTLAVLELVVQSLDDAPSLLLLTAREDASSLYPQLRRALASVGRDARCERIALAGLERDAVARLLEAPETPSPSPALVERVLEVSQGNPLFVCELAALYRRGRLPSEPTDRSALPLPSAVQDTFRLSLESRSPLCRRALGVGSVSGDAFATEVLLRVLEAEHDAVLDALSEAEQAGLIHESGERPGHYRFRHALWREFLYAEFTRADVRRLHLRTAEALEAIHRSDLAPQHAALAAHFGEAAPVGGAARAVHYATLVARRWERVWATRESEKHYELALRALDAVRDPDPRLRGELSLGLGIQLRVRSRDPADVARARACLESAARAALAAPCFETHAKALIELVQIEIEPVLALPGLAVRATPRIVQLQGALALALERLAPGDHATRARTLTWLAHSHHFADAVAARAHALGRARVEAERSGRAELALEAAIASWWFAQAPPLLEQRASIGNRLEEIASALPPALVRHEGWSPYADAERGDWVRGDRSVSAFRARIAREAPDVDDPHVLVWSVMRDTMSGRFDQAERRLEQLQRLDGYLARSAHATQMLWLRRLQGRTTEVLPVAQAGAEVLRVPVTQLMLARCELDTERPESARRRLEDTLQLGLQDVPFDQAWLFTLSLAADGIRALGLGAYAQPIYRALAPFEGRMVMGGWSVVYFGPVSRSLGLLAAAHGARERAVAHLETALRIHSEARALPWVAISQLELGRALVERDAPGDASRARALIDTARQHASDLGMGGLPGQILIYPCVCSAHPPSLEFQRSDA